ncbi:MAG: flagellar hook-associated protein FlgK [Planctomycetota bacterium]|jgi:flagellar hook-associated protein FlgK
MSGISLNIGLKALLTAQSSLDTVGHNIANANTPGYSRQRLEISADRTLGIRGMRVGNGVRAQNITRTFDSFITKRLIHQQSSTQQLDNALRGMGEVEALLGEPDGFGLGGLLDEMFSSMSALSTNAEDLVLRTGLTQAATHMTTQFHELSREVGQLKLDTGSKIEAFANDINVRAREIVELNKEITSIEASGASANDLRDQRDEALQGLAKQIDITFHENGNGAVRVLVGGQLLVGPTNVNELTTTQNSAGGVELVFEGGSQAVQVHAGAIGGLKQFGEDFIPGILEDFDRMAREMILEFNRAHTVGIPQSGGYDQLIGTNRVADSDMDGEFTDELLSFAGLPFTPQDGELFVNVISKATDEMTRTKIDLDVDRMTVGDLMDAINEIPNLSGGVDSFGRVQVFSDAGHTFDFSSRLDENPNHVATFGSGRASITGSEEGPFALSGGETIEVSGTLGNFTIAFAASDFERPGEATAGEVAAAINANASMAPSGLRAVVVADRVALQSAGTGTSATAAVVSGTSLSALGLSAQVSNGHDTEIGVEMAGTYSGDINDRWEFRPNMDGEIGTTAGLEIEVINSRGVPVATLDVGADYTPGNSINVADGLEASFSFGNVSATDGDFFTQDVISDSDSSDMLVALGLGTFFVGSDAESIELREELIDDPTMLALSGTGAEGDNSALLKLITLQQGPVDGLNATFGDFYGDVIGDIAFEISSTQNSLEVEEFLTQSLSDQREQISGVNVDEELVEMVQFEQAYQAAARFLQVVNSVTDELMRLL